MLDPLEELCQANVGFGQEPEHSSSRWNRSAPVCCLSKPMDLWISLLWSFKLSRTLVRLGTPNGALAEVPLRQKVDELRQLRLFLVQQSEAQKPALFVSLRSCVGGQPRGSPWGECAKGIWQGANIWEMSTGLSADVGEPNSGSENEAFDHKFSQKAAMEIALSDDMCHRLLSSCLDLCQTSWQSSQELPHWLHKLSGQLAEPLTRLWEPEKIRGWKVLWDFMVRDLEARNPGAFYVLNLDSLKSPFKKTEKAKQRSSLATARRELMSASERARGAQIDEMVVG